MKKKRFIERQMGAFLASRAEGKDWQVVLIEAGWSLNGRYYSPSTLKEAVPLFEGSKAQAYQYGNKLPVFSHLPDSEDKNGESGKYIANTVGFFKNAHYGTFTNKQGKLSEGILADFHILEGHDWLRKNARDAFENGFATMLGFSIDARGDAQTGIVSGKSGLIVKKINQVVSTDVVSNPAAGGNFLRLVADLGEFQMKYLLSLFVKYRAAWVASLKESNVPDDEKALRIIECAIELAQKAILGVSITETQEMGNVARGIRTLSDAHSLATAGKGEEAGRLLEAWFTANPEDSSTYKSFSYPQKSSTPPPPPPAQQPPASFQESAEYKTMQTRISEMERRAERGIYESNVRARVSDSKLPPASKAKLQEDLLLIESSLPVEVIDARIKREADYVASITPTPSPTGLGGAYGGPRVEITEDQKDKLQISMDLMIAGKEMDDKGNTAFVGMREAFTKYNPQACHYNNYELTQRIWECVARAFPHKLGDCSNEPLDAIQKHTKYIKENWDNIRSPNLKEAVVSSEFTNAFGTSMFRRLQDIYRNDPSGKWRTIVSPQYTSLSDATHGYDIIRMGGIPTLPRVGERAAYQDLIESPTEAKETITPGKYGGIYALTWEAMLADNLRVLRNIPFYLARSSNRTISQAVFNLLNNNVTLAANSAALISNTNNNLISGNPSLGYSGIVSGITLMRNQTEQDSNLRLELAPKYLLTGAKTEAIAWELTSSDRKATTAEDSTLESFVKGMNIQPFMSVDLATSGSAQDDYWWLLCDPSEVETLVIGFLGGRSTPDIFVQGEQTPTAGQYFTADQITFKIRLVFGTTALDPRGIAGSQPA